jgi:ATP-dependent Clp protease, protease subunit
MKERTIIRFLAEINQQSANALMSVVEKLIREGKEDILLLISSPGGSVFHGLSLHNFLKRAPINIETCNFGSIDSIACVVYCAGTKKYCLPNSRFLLHSISFNVRAESRFEEKKLREIVGSLEMDRKNISEIIAENSKKTQEEVEEIMLEGLTYDSKEAKSFGLVDKIVEELFDEDEEIIGIG